MTDYSPQRDAMPRLIKDQSDARPTYTTQKDARPTYTPPTYTRPTYTVQSNARPHFVRVRRPTLDDKL